VVRLEQEVSDKDASGRLLRHVWLSDVEIGEDVLLGELLISEGYAEAQALPPDTMRADDLRAAEADARARRAGKWSACA
jgi:endonuclease YncB( thermonuclease family)